MIKRRILLISAGDINPSFLVEYTNKYDFFMTIAIDGGLYAARECGIIPDVILGDFDSVSSQLLDDYQAGRTKILKYPKEKDLTDTEIGIELAIKEGADELVMFGCTGSRWDHTVANIHLLVQTLDKNISAFLINENNKIYLKKNSFSIKKEEQHGHYVSLLPFGGQVTGLTLKGMKYPLDHIVLSPGVSLGISNEIIDEIADISFDEGVLLVFETRDCI